MSEVLAEKSIRELAPMIKTKAISPVDLTDSVMNQIRLRNEELNAYLDVYEDEARQMAIQSEQEIMDGLYRGPLHGIPMGLKDNFYIKDKRTTMGSLIHQNFKPSHDATIVKKLTQHGVIITGKLNLDEYAYGITTENPHFGTSRNPWNPARITGGSSGGSASAVSASMSLASIGSETGGSLRAPSSFCGLVSIKPTYGRVSKYGCYPLAPTLDHVGPMAKTVYDTALLLNALAGYDDNDITSSKHKVEDYTQYLTDDVTGLVIGLDENYFLHDVDPDVKESVMSTVQNLEKLGAHVKKINFSTINDARYAYALTLAAEASAVHHSHMHSRAVDYGKSVRSELYFGETVSAVDYIHAQTIRQHVVQEFEEVFQQVDVIMSPTVPFVAPSIGEKHVMLNNQKVAFGDHVSRLIRPTTLIGIPAATVPCGLSDGMPIGVQILSAPFKEGVILNVAHVIEQMGLLNK